MYLRSQFQQWYASEITSQNGAANDVNFEPVDMSAPRMKAVGAKWLVSLYEHFLESPDIIINGFLASGIPQSIDNKTPYLHESDSSEDESSSSEDEYSSSEDEYSSSEDEFSSEDKCSSENSA